jgi:hypothetical protein
MSSNMTADSELQERFDRIQLNALVVGGLGLVVCALAWVIWPAQIFPAYLVGFLYWIGISLGCIGLAMLHHLVGGSWGLVIRRPLESGALNVLPLAVLFLPVAFGVKTLYPWAHDVSAGHEALIEHSPYLTESFFWIRAAVYFATWIAMALVLNGLSDRQDATTDPAPSRLLQGLAGPATVLLFLGGTFSAIDWGMSLDPHWTSTIYGPMVIVGDALTTLALMIVVAGFLASDRPMLEIATRGRLNDLGNLLLAFVMLWAYMSFCQFLIIWSGNLTEEIPWYLRRTTGGWQWVALGLIVFQFFLPFFVLLFRENKRQTTRVSRVALWILALHWINLVWLVIPAKSDPASPHIPWAEVFLSLVATVGIGGIWVSFFIRALKRRPLVPLHDPNLIAALEHDGGH